MAPEEAGQDTEYGRSQSDGKDRSPFDVDIHICDEYLWDFHIQLFKKRELCVLSCKVSH